MRITSAALALLPAARRAKIESDLARIDQFVRLDVARSERLNAVELMTILLEDRHFFEHGGVDPRGVLREVSRILRWRRHGGASTIDMQFVRTATGYRGNTMKRKLYEALLAILIQTRYPKLQILRSYLAVAFFGSGLQNADAAAKKLFGKRAANLDLEQGAWIAALLACPRPLNGSPTWYARAQRRARYGLKIYRTRFAETSPMRGRIARLDHRPLRALKDFTK